MGLHVAQMTGTEEIRRCFEAVTTNGAAVMGLDGYGMAPGCNADLVVLQAGSVHEAIRLRANRLFVIRRGRIIAETAPVTTRLSLESGPVEIDFRHPVSPATKEG